MNEKSPLIRDPDDPLYSDEYDELLERLLGEEMLPGQGSHAPNGSGNSRSCTPDMTRLTIWTRGRRNWAGAG